MTHPPHPPIIRIHPVHLWDMTHNWRRGINITLRCPRLTQFSWSMLSLLKSTHPDMWLWFRNAGDVSWFELTSEGRSQGIWADLQAPHGRIHQHLTFRACIKHGGGTCKLWQTQHACLNPKHSIPWVDIEVCYNCKPWKSHLIQDTVSHILQWHVHGTNILNWDSMLVTLYSAEESVTTCLVLFLCYIIVTLIVYLPFGPCPLWWGRSWPHRCHSCWWPSCTWKHNNWSLNYMEIYYLVVPSKWKCYY